MLRIQLIFMTLLAGGTATLVPWWLGQKVTAPVIAEAERSTQRALLIAKHDIKDVAADLLHQGAVIAGRYSSGQAPIGTDSPPLVWLLDRDGRILEGRAGVQVGGKPSVAGMIVVRAALNGIASDSFVVLREVSDKPEHWHLAARPVAGSLGEVAGVVVVGHPLSVTAKRLTENLEGVGGGKSLLVALRAGDDIMGHSVPKVVVQRMNSGTATGKVSGAGDASLGYFLKLEKAAWMIGVSSMPSEAGRVFVAVASDVRQGLLGLADWLDLAALAAVSMLLLAMIFSQILARRINQSAARIVTWLQGWRQGRAQGPLNAERVHHMFNRIVRNIDFALQARPQVSAPGGTLDRVLDMDDEESVIGEFSGLDSKVFDPVDAAAVAPSKVEPAGGKAPGVDLFAGLSTPSGPPAEGLPDLPDLPALPPIPEAAGGQAPATSGLPDLPASAQAGETNSEIGQFEVSSAEHLAPVDAGGFGDEATGQFEVPQNLLDQISQAPQELDFSDDPMRNLFDQYVALRASLGEKTEGLEFERFLKKLEATKAKILEESGAVDVEFSVREKEGRASLRALPVPR
jgi:hypothetical protein